MPLDSVVLDPYRDYSVAKAHSRKDISFYDFDYKNDKTCNMLLDIANFFVRRKKPLSESEIDVAMNKLIVLLQPYGKTFHYSSDSKGGKFSLKTKKTDMDIYSYVTLDSSKMVKLPEYVHGNTKYGFIFHTGLSISKRCFDYRVFKFPDFWHGHALTRLYERNPSFDGSGMDIFGKTFLSNMLMLALVKIAIIDQPNVKTFGVPCQDGLILGTFHDLCNDEYGDIARRLADDQAFLKKIFTVENKTSNSPILFEMLVYFSLLNKSFISIENRYRWDSDGMHYNNVFGWANSIVMGTMNQDYKAAWLNEPYFIQKMNSKDKFDFDSVTMTRSFYGRTFVDRSQLFDNQIRFIDEWEAIRHELEPFNEIYINSCVKNSFNKFSDHQFKTKMRPYFDRIKSLLASYNFEFEKSSIKIDKDEFGDSIYEEESSSLSDDDAISNENCDLQSGVMLSPK